MSIWNMFGSKPAFDGTTADLLSTLPQEQERVFCEECPFDGCVDPAPAVPQVCNHPDDQRAVNVEILKLAFEIEKKRTASAFVTIDVGSLPKAKAEALLQQESDKFRANSTGLHFFAKREGGAVTQIEIADGKPSLNNVITIAHKLREFVDSY